ncbi:MAG: TIGR02147 family protein, partial [Bdellovibrionota bacterium]
MDLLEITPQAWLQAEYEARRRKNPSYSLRRMAQQLEVSSGRLSELLSGRRQLTRAAAEKIATKLAYDPEKKKKLLDLVEIQRNPANPPPTSHENYLQLSADAFHVIADWHHFAILSLIDLDDFDPAPAAIAKRLGISTIEARSSLERMTRLGLIVEKNGALEKTS